MSSGESLGLFGVSETLGFEVPQVVRTLRVVTKYHDPLSVPHELVPAKTSSYPGNPEAPEEIPGPLG